MGPFSGSANHASPSDVLFLHIPYLLDSLVFRPTFYLKFLEERLKTVFLLQGSEGISLIGSIREILDSGMIHDLTLEDVRYMTRSVMNNNRFSKVQGSAISILVPDRTAVMESGN